MLGEMVQGTHHSDDIAIAVFGRHGGRERSDAGKQIKERTAKGT